MRALVAKELRQVLPGHLLLVLVFAGAWWLALTPDALVAPNPSDLSARHRLLAGVYLLEGLVLGFAQFGMERWNNTEAYLLHRGTGSGGAFAAKLAAALVALVAIVVAPPLLWGLGHALAGTWIAGAPLAHLGHAMAASSTALGGFAVGAFATQVHGGWPRRVLLAVLGACTVLYAANLAAQPVAGLESASIARFVGVQFALALGVVAVTFAMFRTGEEGARTTSAGAAAAFAFVALELFTMPYVVGPMTGASALRRAAIASGPQVLEGPEGELYLARQRGPRRWEIRDARGERVPDELARTYDGYGRRDTPFESLYRPLSTPLAWLGPQEDAFAPYPARRWVFAPQVRRVLTPGGDAWYDVARGRLSAVVREGPLSARWVELDVPARMGVSYAHGQPFGERAAPLLVDAESGRLWSLRADPGREPRLVEEHLPDGDQVVGGERVQSRTRLKVGLHEPVTYSSPLAVVGERGTYLWDGARLGLLSEVDPALADRASPESDRSVQVARLVPRDVDGLGYTLEVVDTESGATLLEADYHAGPMRAGLLHLATLASAPACALVSWTRPAPTPREADQNGRSPLADRMLAGRSNTGLLFAVLALGALLALSTWRFLERAGAALPARVLWTLGALCFGPSAWFLARFFAPRPTRRRAATQREPSPRTALEIVTA